MSQPAQNLPTEVIERTLEACAWLLPIAQKGLHEDSDAAFTWLDALGYRAHLELVRRGVREPWPVKKKTASSAGH